MSDKTTEPTDKVVRITQFVDEATESIDIFTLFTQDITSTGSFDLRGVAHSSLGKLLRALPMQAFLIDEHSTIIFSNGPKERDDNFSDPAVERSIFELFPRSRDADCARILVAKTLAHRKPQVMEALVQLRERKLWGRLHLRTLRMGASRFVLVLIEDLTLERRQLILDRKHELELRKARDDLELRVRERTAELRLAGRVIDCSNEAIMITDCQNTIIQVNEAFSKITGYSAEEIIGQDCSSFPWGPSSGDLGAKIWRAIQEKGEWQGEAWEQHKGGKTCPILLSISAVRDDSDRVTHHVAIFTDISKLKETERRLARLAHFDSLTGLPNRMLFRCRLQQTLARKRGTGLVAVMLLDLDRFKNINETMGHRFGDKVLIEVAKSLSRSIDRGATAARLGGDEFAILLPDVSTKDDVTKATNRIMEELSECMLVGGREVFITASIGIALVPQDGETVDSLLQNSDTALHFAKEGGNNRFRFFSSSMNAEVLRRQKLEHLIRMGLVRGQFVLHYQPLVDVASMKLIGAEALLRWSHPSRGPVTAEKLVPIAEDTGLIIPLGEWVLRTACLQNREWQNMGLQPLRMSVNLSGRQMKEKGILESIRRILDETELYGSYLDVELTESTMLEDKEGTYETLSELKRHGVGIVIDDFGTGYSSLNYLRSLPADKLKIDKSFVEGISNDSYHQVLVRAILEVAHTRNLTVVAEGVENLEQLTFLQANRCDQVQGYFICKPVPANIFTALLREGGDFRARLGPGRFTPEA